jgi:hypothetical protein
VQLFWPNLRRALDHEVARIIDSNRSVWPIPMEPVLSSIDLRQLRV